MCFKDIINGGLITRRRIDTIALCRSAEMVVSWRGHAKHYVSASMCSADLKANQPLDFSRWESIAQSSLYRGQLEPVQRWISGRVLDVASNYGRFSALTRTAV